MVWLQGRDLFPPARAWISNKSPNLVPIYSNPIMFAKDLCHSQIEYFRNAIDLNWKDRAKPPARRGCSTYASESDTTNLHSSIVNIQFRLVRVGYLPFIIWHHKSWVWQFRPGCIVLAFNKGHPALSKSTKARWPWTVNSEPRIAKSWTFERLQLGCTDG